MSFPIRHDVLFSHAVILQLVHQDRVSTFKQKSDLFQTLRDLWSQVFTLQKSYSILAKNLSRHLLYLQFFHTNLKYD